MLLQDFKAVLDALNPFAYEYAGLSSLYSPGLQRPDYDAVRRWWDELNLSQWIPQDFPSTVRCFICGSLVFAALVKYAHVLVCSACGHHWDVLLHIHRVSLAHHRKAEGNVSAHL